MPEPLSSLNPALHSIIFQSFERMSKDISLDQAKRVQANLDAGMLCIFDFNLVSDF
jgi:hypothetical protein